jgi:hypothetical protein
MNPVPSHPRNTLDDRLLSPRYHAVRRTARVATSRRPEARLRDPSGGAVVLDHMNKRLARMALLACLILPCLLATSCGRNSAGNAVAHIGTTTTASTSLAGPSVTSLGGLQSAQLAFAQCMRSHGVPAYPDPGSQGELPTSKAAAGGQLNVNSPRFQSGLRSCRSLLPSTPASPAQQAAVTAKAVKFAKCMRAHGLPSFPDPGVAPGGGKLPSAGYFVAAQSGALSPSNPQFVRAQTACRRVTGAFIERAATTARPS